MYVAILVIIIIIIIIILQVQGRTETDTDIQNGQESRTVQVSYILLIFSAYLLLKTSDNVLAIKGVYKRANAFLDIHVFDITIRCCIRFCKSHNGFLLMLVTKLL